MMSGHGANPVFFNKNIKIERPEHLLTPSPPASDNISILPYPLSPLHPSPPTFSLKKDVICVPLLII